MSKIRILTPTHISSGEVYYAAYIKDNFLYSLDSIIGILNFNDAYNENLYKELGDKKNLSRVDLISKFRFDRDKLIPSNSVGRIKANCNIKGQVYALTKSGKSNLIPGSSIKGYVINVLYYDVICKNAKVRNFLENEFKKIYEKYLYDFSNCKNNKEKAELLFRKVNREVSRVIETFVNDSKYINRLIGFRDIVFNSDLSICEVDRFYKDDIKKTALPQGNYEVLEPNTEYNGDIYFKVSDLSKDHAMKVYEDVKKNICLTNKNNSMEIYKLEFLKEAYDRIENFETWFYKANKDFMDVILDNEMEYVLNLDNNLVDNNKLLAEYKKLKEINNNKIIMQIGKNTNFMIKTVSLAFKEIYEKYFAMIFSPQASNYKSLKLFPKIDMMPLVKVNSKGCLPLGFIEMEL